MGLGHTDHLTTSRALNEVEIESQHVWSEVELFLAGITICQELIIVGDDISSFDISVEGSGIESHGPLDN